MNIRFICYSTLFRCQQIILIYSALAVILCNCLYAQSSSGKRVLYINSYHRGYLWSDFIEEGIRSGLGNDVDVTTAYLDAKRPDSEHLMSLNEALIKAKLEEKSVDLIITSDNSAFDFVIENRDGFLKGIPLVACGLNYLVEEDLQPYSNLVGIAEIGDPLRNIELALGLFPKTEELVLLSDLSLPKSDEVIQQVYDIYAEKFDIRFVSSTSEDSTESIIENISATDTAKIIINFGIAPASGLDLDAYHLRDLEIAKVPYPIFVSFEGTIVGEVFGGLCQDAESQGRISAQIATDILNGKNPKDIPHILENVEKLVFNYEALIKFGIKPSSLPEEATIINAPESRYMKVRRYLIIALGIIIGLSIVLTILLYEVFRRKRAERSLVLALKKADEASTAKSNFMMVMSHELLTPLNAVIGFTNLMGDEENPQIQRDHLNEIQTQSHLLVKLIRRILEYSNFDSTSTAIKVCRPKALFRKTEGSYHSLVEAKGLELKCSVLGDQKQFPMVNCEIIETLVDLLVDNAVKFSERGRISLNIHIPELSIRKRGTLTIEVSDEGIGIANEDIPYLFEPFHQIDNSSTRRYGGVGLGLATCKKLVNSIDGTIHCKSELGKGSTFTLRIACDFVTKNKFKKLIRKQEYMVT